MATIAGGVSVTGFIAPNDSADQYPVTDEQYNKGGFRTTANTTERDAITTLRRKEGMLVYVISTDTIYQLVGGVTNTNWIPKSIGSGTSDSNYIYNQTIASATWNIAHNLGKYTSITVVDSGLTEVEGDIQHIDLNNVIITFSAPFSGKAFFN